MPIVYLAIGSNLGDRPANIHSAKMLLEESGVSILQCSSIIETDPVGGPANQSKYLNGVLKVKTNLKPIELLKTIKAIEQKLGRIKTERNGPRPIDLDILLYDQLQYQSLQLTIPHPRMFEREFVMNPLKEINASLVENLTHAHP